MKITIRHVTVEPYESVLEFRDGQVLRSLGPGRFRRTRRARYQAFDLREQQLSLAPQQLTTGDGLSIKISAVVRWAVDDPEAFVSRAVAPLDSVYLAVQLALRDALAALTAEELLSARSSDVAGVATERAVAVGEPLGVAVREVVIKDVIAPPEIRLAATELVTARQRGQARLEEARAETAALRSLANAAKLLDDHPALARLRLVQAAPHGTQVTLTVP